MSTRVYLFFASVCIYATIHMILRTIVTAKMHHITFVSQYHITSLVSRVIENHRDLIPLVCVCVCTYERERAYIHMWYTVMFFVEVIS